ncbi:hypothetical protein [Kaistella jeonii]|uniref:Uncharacterized protein n=1 Tax=Kaistella jeonii TaxID=266749 RepID=A0A0C1FG01_9FLAO|nr:hypothetical protein [Kaistella jeonii]KIA90728.1 hypothetical protein OA86_02335 [Kaistella jeonii]SFB68609.1 hypothetical protein SAMN05421876_10148 [Kaistella jeonii]VEI94655.1 Uncharacterised protein [Kaistella jeonii]
MSNEKDIKKSKDAEVKKQNEDFPNIPVSSEKVDSGKTMKKQIKETSKLHEDGKTDNTEKNSEN